jgi:uncharacterized ParB-like nuclease family protein
LIGYDFCNSFLFLNFKARFDLGKGLYTLGHCPICCLNCECSACSRKVNNLAREFKEECRKQKLPGPKSEFGDMLGRCATVSGARCSSFVAWDAETTDTYYGTSSQASTGQQNATEMDYVEPPKKPSGAYVFFGHDMRPKIFEENPETKFTELGKILGDRWRACTPDERKKYEDLSDADKARYQKEMKEYGEKRREAAKKNGILNPIDDIEVPQKPYPAYFQFANARRMDIKRANPDASNAEVSRMLSDMWRSSSDEFKDFHVKEEAKQRKIYKGQMEEYQKKVQERYDRMEAMAPQTAQTTQPQMPSEQQVGFVNTSDIELPQKPYPAYFQFANCRRLEIKGQNQGASSVEITRILSGMWKSASDEFKATFVKEETKQRKAYKIAMEEYHNKIRERYSQVGVAYPGSSAAATSSSRYQVDHGKVGLATQQHAMVRQLPIPAVSDEVFEEQTRNLESLLEQLQAYHPAPFPGYPSQKPEKKKDRPVIPIGTVFKKSVDDLGDFKGKITRTPVGVNPYYDVEYEDGHEEELSINGLIPLLPDDVKEEYERALKIYEAPARKKRGRPREDDKEDEEYVPDEVALGEPKKKRGRPRKYRPASEETHSEQPKQKQGRPKRARDEPYAIDEEPQQKRGRPRKSLEPSANGESPKKRRGRPRKSFVVLETVEADEDSPKKRRGRPRKALELLHAEDSPKKRGGRPKKASVVSNPVMAEDSPVKRGRTPRKTVEVAEDAPKKRRGRPRKSVDMPEPVVAEDLPPKKRQGRPPKKSFEESEPAVFQDLPKKRRSRPLNKSLEVSNPTVPDDLAKKSHQRPSKSLHEIEPVEPVGEPKRRRRRPRSLA